MRQLKRLGGFYLVAVYVCLPQMVWAGSGSIDSEVSEPFWKLALFFISNVGKTASVISIGLVVLGYMAEYKDVRMLVKVFFGSMLFFMVPKIITSIMDLAGIS